MWALAITFLIIVIIRYAVRAYQQQRIINEIVSSDATTGKVGESSTEVESEKAEVADVAEATKSEKSDAANEDYDEYSTGHNVTKILTGPGSQKFHLSKEQIEQGKKVNQELLERMAKRKIHSE